jgi:hypothetical protein
MTSFPSRNSGWTSVSLHFTLLMTDPPCPQTRLTNKVRKRRFTPEEDSALCTLFSVFGQNQWDEIAQFIPQRTPRQCRERYENYLATNILNLAWTQSDDELLLRMISVVGHRWTSMIEFFPGRNINNLKNRWHKVLSKREREIDLRTGDRPNPNASEHDAVMWFSSEDSESDWPIAKTTEF